MLYTRRIQAQTKKVGWGGWVGWVGWVNNVHVPLQNYVMLPWYNVLARLHIYAVLRWCNVLARLRNYVTVVHMRSEWTRKVRVRGKTKVAGTQQIDRCWNHLKEICPSQMKNRTGPTINARFWDRIYQWIYRHNMSKWDMTTTCKMNETFRHLM